MTLPHHGRLAAGDRPALPVVVASLHGGGRRGAVLITVLGAMLLVAAISFAALFGVTLQTLAARSAARGAADDAALQGALALAAAAMIEGRGGPDDLGPWPEHGVDARVRVVEVAGGGLLLEAYLERSPTYLRARVALELEPEVRVVRRP